MKPRPSIRVKPLDELRLRLWSIPEILALPEPEWLVKPLFPKGALVVVYGPSGSGKSFVALDWALSTACLEQWLGYDVVTPGRVVYVVGEGKGGIRKRITAWLQEHGQLTTVPGAFCLLEPVQLLKEADITLFLTRVAALRPELVVLDTFATCFDGDENHPKDMSKAIAAAKQIIRETGATVILVHHTGKKGLEERGHSAMRAAADTMILVEKKKDGFDSLVHISNTKQKDETTFPKITVRLKRVAVGTTDDGEELTSCVLAQSDAAATLREDLNAGQLQALMILAQGAPDGMNTTEWRAALAHQDGAPMPKKTYHNYRQALLDRGLAEGVPGRPRHYRATDLGKATVLAWAQSEDRKSQTVGDSRQPPAAVPMPTECQPSANGTGPQSANPTAPPKGAVAQAQDEGRRS